ncbi:MAG TPA: hypothetical protein VFS20_16865, partial [Longimicrobium sp.]|nr:hypothetical protein [Longimicrobium sp.]
MESPMRNERRTSGSGMGAAETSAGNRATAPPPHFHDEDGAPIEDAPQAYVSIDSPRNAAPSGEADPRDAIIRDLAQINADVVRTIAERFGNVMQAAADVLRAADGAGLSRREPPPLPPSPAPTREEDEADDEEDDADDEDRPLAPSERAWALVEPMLPAIGAWISAMVAKRFSAAPLAPPPPPA